MQTLQQALHANPAGSACKPRRLCMQILQALHAFGLNLYFPYSFLLEIDHLIKSELVYFICMFVLFICSMKCVYYGLSTMFRVQVIYGLSTMLLCSKFLCKIHPTLP